jgi:hypothetical protein
MINSDWSTPSNPIEDIKRAVERCMNLCKLPSPGVIICKPGGKLEELCIKAGIPMHSEEEQKYLPE